jgi:hypothetical protein
MSWRPLDFPRVLSRHWKLLAPGSDRTNRAISAPTRTQDPSFQVVLARSSPSWSSSERYDVVFFSAWLLHVPPQRFEEFWALVLDCLNDTGRVFVIGELPGVAATEQTVEVSAGDSSTRQINGPGPDRRSSRSVTSFGEQMDQALRLETLLLQFR